MYHPMPYFTPIISAVISVMNEAPVPLKIPTKMLGAAAGRATLKILCSVFAPRVLDTSK